MLDLVASLDGDEDFGLWEFIGAIDQLLEIQLTARLATHETANEIVLDDETLDRVEVAQILPLERLA